MELHNMHIICILMVVSKKRGSSQMDGLKWRIPTKIDDLGAPPFMETSICIILF